MATGCGGGRRIGAGILPRLPLGSWSDGRHVTFAIETDCDKTGQVATALAGRQLLDAFPEISPAGESVLMATVRGTLKGCCSGCAVPAGLFKAMQVAAGLALPKDISMHITKTER